METTLLKDLVKNAYIRTFIVRIRRIWQHWSADSTILYGLNFVMVDRKGGTTEGMIPSDKMNKVKNNIQEGVIYRIQRYLRAKEKYRAVDHPRLSFINKTIVDPISPQPPSSQCTSVCGARKMDWIKIILISDVIGLINAVMDHLPATGAAGEPRSQIFFKTRSQIFIMDGHTNIAGVFFDDSFRSLSEAIGQYLLRGGKHGHRKKLDKGSRGTEQLQLPICLTVHDVQEPEMTEKYLKLRDTTSSLQGLTSFLVNSNISRILALLCLPASTSLSFHKRHEGGGPSKESGGSAGHPCRSSREEAATGDTFKQLSYCKARIRLENPPVGAASAHNSCGSGMQVGSPPRGLLLQGHGAAPQLIQ